VRLFVSACLACARAAGQIYSDVDIAATPNTTKFFLGLLAQGPLPDLVVMVENDSYDNFFGRLHWRLGISPLYARVPQLRQSFFYSKQGHPKLLDLLFKIETNVRIWHRSQHKEIGNPLLSARALHRMDRSGALTLELTGPGVFTDVIKPKSLGQTSIILSSTDGLLIIRYSSMGSWKNAEHKKDVNVYRGIVVVYGSPILFTMFARFVSRCYAHKSSVRLRDENI
jgi:hypothetical protein